MFSCKALVVLLYTDVLKLHDPTNYLVIIDPKFFPLTYQNLIDGYLHYQQSIKLTTAKDADAIPSDSMESCCITSFKMACSAGEWSVFHIVLMKL